METVENLEYDFGFGPVPAHPHPKGGGWVANTAHVDLSCYVGPYSQVYGKAKVTHEAKIDGYAKIFGEARIIGNAKVYGDAKVYQNALISGNARISGEAKIYGSSIVTDEALVYESAEVYDNARVRNWSEVHGKARVKGHAEILENATICDDCIVTRTPLVASGMGLSKTIVTDHHITHGCVTLPPSIWKEHGKTMIRFFVNMHQNVAPKQLAEKWIELIVLAGEVHGCSDMPEEIANFNLKETISKLLANDRFWIQK